MNKNNKTLEEELDKLKSDIVNKKEELNNINGKNPEGTLKAKTKQLEEEIKQLENKIKKHSVSYTLRVLDDVTEEYKKTINDVTKEYKKTNEEKFELEKQIEKIKDNDKNLKEIERLKSKNQRLEKKAQKGEKEINPKTRDFYDSESVIKNLEADRDKLEEKNEKLRIEITGKGKGKSDRDLAKYYFDIITKNFTPILFILMFSLGFSFLSDNEAMGKLYNLIKEGDVNQTFIGRNVIYFQIIMSVLTIGTILLLFLPREKLKNAREGLEKFENVEFKDFLKKFEEVHNQIKLTEKLESDYSRSLALRDITNTVKTEDEQISREGSAKRIWIASNNLKNDTKEEILKSVLNKLTNNNIEYIWIIPKDSLVAKQGREIIEDEIRLFDKTNDIKGKFKIIETGEDTSWMLTHDIVVYDYPDLDTSVWESTFESRYLELPSGYDGSIHFALRSIIESAEEKNLIIFSNKDL